MHEIVRQGVNDFEHPAHDEIVAYVDGAFDAVDQEIVESHLATCRMCAEDVDDLRSVARSHEAVARHERPQRHEKRSLWYFAAGLAAAAAVAGVVVWNGSGRESRPVDLVATRPVPGERGAGRRESTRPPAPSMPPPVLVALKDGDGTVQLDAAGTLTATVKLEDRDRTAVVEALRDGRVPVPASIVAPGGRPGTLLGAPARPPGLGPVTPLATAVDTPRPIFEWTMQPGATSYVVSVFDQNLDKVAQSEPLAGQRWTPPAPLPRGREYAWQIRARTPAGEVTAPAPPAPEARFTVLSQEDAGRVETWRREYAGSPLTLGVLLARIGLVEEARLYFDRIVAANPASPQARQLAASVRRP